MLQNQVSESEVICKNVYLLTIFSWISEVINVQMGVFVCLFGVFCGLVFLFSWLVGLLGRRKSLFIMGSFHFIKKRFWCLTTCICHQTKYESKPPPYSLFQKIINDKSLIKNI